MTIIRFKLPTIDQVNFTVEALPEDLPIRGNIMASGDDDVDKEVEETVIRQLENGNVWAWCIIEVTAEYKGYTGVDYLGGCSYRSRADFEKDAYCKDMKRQAFEALLLSLQALDEPTI
jgi:hypothetical protein